MLGNFFNDPFSFVVWAIALLVSITIHEFSHAFLANYLGDPTAKLQGRLTLNPLAHLDPLGTLLILFAHFGWGKPVPVDPYNLRNPKRDSALISLAGPASNLLLALLLSFALHFTLSLTLTSPLLLYTKYLILNTIIMSVSLAIFNLAPIHPLDGFAIVLGILPEDLSRQWEELRGYGMIFLLLLIFPFGNGSLITNLISPLISLILNLLLPGLGRIV